MEKKANVSKHLIDQVAMMYGQWKKAGAKNLIEEMHIVF